ncbi:MAG: efflux RND transporter periplasmic adaptor subunit [Desulfomonile tiedjei]|nr:efflux RND transporter periplasmic adaptor subunit [Desulfomonile tiedjei]
MNKKKIALLVALVFLAVVGLGVMVHLRDRNHVEGKIFVSGNIEATETDLSFRLSGQIISLPIEEGDRLKKNQVVAKLDIDTLTAQKGAAEADLANARAVLDELEEGTRVEEIAQARAQWKAAESRLKLAKDEYHRYLALFREGVVSASNFDSRDSTYKVALEDYNNSTQRLKELETGPREQQIRAARARWEGAQWNLERIKLDIEHSTLATPTASVVLVKAAELGEVTLPGATVATVAAIDEVWLKGYVSERDLGKVKLGQKAEITTDTFPGKIYPGVVTFISSRAEFTPKNVQTREERIKQVFRVKVTIQNPEQELKIGMPAEGYVVVDEEHAKKAGVSTRGK